MITALETITNENKLEQETAAMLKDRFLPIIETIKEWEEKAKMFIVTDVTQTKEMKMAREARLIVKNVRIKADKVREELKSDALKYGRTVQAIYNAIETHITPIEDHLMAQENFAKIKEEAAKDQRLLVRTGEITGFEKWIPYGTDIREMPEENYRIFLKGLEVQEEAERVAEQQQREAEAKQLLHKLRQRELLPFTSVMTEEECEMNLSDKTDDEFIAMKQIIIDRKQSIDAENERVRLENEQLKKDREAQDKLIREQQASAERKAQEIRDAAAEKIKKEREAKEKAESELKEKQAAEEAEKNRVLREQAAADKKRLAEERKALKAPIKAQLNKWVDGFNIGKPLADNETSELIINKFESFCKWAKEQIEQL